MDLQGVIDQTKEFEFQFDGQTLKGRFFQFRTTTPGYLKRLIVQRDKAEKEEEVVYTALLQPLSEAVESWDMTNAGEPFPPTAENLEKVPLSLLLALTEHLAGLRANPTESKPPSLTGSPPPENPEASSENVPTGMSA